MSTDRPQGNFSAPGSQVARSSQADDAPKEKTEGQAEARTGPPLGLEAGPTGGQKASAAKALMAPYKRAEFTLCTPLGCGVWVGRGKDAGLHVSSCHRAQWDI